MKKITSPITLLFLMFVLCSPMQAQKDPWPVDLDVSPEEVIAFAYYTTHDGTLKMTAQLYPLDEGIDRTVRLQVKEGADWQTVTKTEVNEEPFGAPQENLKRWSAHFRVEEPWVGQQDRRYRVVAAGGHATYSGLIRKQPDQKEVIKVASLSCNASTDTRLKPDLIRNIQHQDPDLLFFAGDQSYHHRKHFQAWILFGMQFGEVMRNRPTVPIPDDHDIGQYNLWGEAGVKAKGMSGSDGGYTFSPQYVNSVQNAQTWHLPDPYDPSPVERDIGVYYTSLNVGGVDFAIVEDRKFKTGPKGLIPESIPSDRPDHVTDPDWDPQTVNLPEARLLGDRQISFLKDWVTNWNNTTFKAVLSQSPFASTAHRHGTYENRLYGDLDSNGWPQHGRNRALRVIRKAFAPQIAGDQHLSTVVRNGINEWEDAPYSITSPGIVNLYKRWWDPRGKPDGRAIDGPLPQLGEYFDPLGNKVTMHAYANPSDERDGKWGEWGKNASGYNLIRFNKSSRKITVENWPRGVDVRTDEAEQYTGWPVTFHQKDNYDRTPIAHLPEITVEGLTDPLLEIHNQQTGELVYAYRINGQRVQPPVFKDGLYRVRIGKQPDRMKTLSDIKAEEGEQPDREITVTFE